MNMLISTAVLLLLSGHFLKSFQKKCQRMKKKVTFFFHLTMPVRMIFFNDFWGHILQFKTPESNVSNNKWMQIQTCQKKTGIMFTFKESPYFKHRRGQRSSAPIHAPLNDKGWNTKRTFNLFEPHSGEVAALLRRRAARETRSGTFQLHRKTEATTSWHSFRLWGRRLLDERREEWAWTGTADSGCNSLTDWPQ